jgi:hypothetical protein
VGKPESLASEWSQLSDYSGPDPAESAYKVRKPERSEKDIPVASCKCNTVQVKTGNFLQK